MPPGGNTSRLSATASADRKPRRSEPASTGRAALSHKGNMQYRGAIRNFGGKTISWGRRAAALSPKCPRGGFSGALLWSRGRRSSIGPAFPRRTRTLRTGPVRFLPPETTGNSSSDYRSGAAYPVCDTTTGREMGRSVWAAEADATKSRKMSGGLSRLDRVKPTPPESWHSCGSVIFA